MKILSAILYGVCSYVGGFLGEIWHMHRDPHYFPELGLEGAAVGLALFAALYGIMIYAYGAGSRVFRKDKDRVAGYALSAVLGLSFWFIILPLHKFVRDGLGLPDAVWWIESALICAVSFEVIRFLHAPSKKRA
jgi:hypothetical protein